MKSNYTSTEPRSKLPLTSAIGLIGVAAAAGVYAVRQRRRADFANRNVLIGGASRGLGLELAREFAKQGANLILLARDGDRLAAVKQEFESAGSRVLTATCDVTNENEVRGTVTRFVTELGRIDVLVNNAGIIEVGPAEHMEVDDYAAAMKVHYWGRCI